MCIGAKFVSYAWIEFPRAFLWFWRIKSIRRYKSGYIAYVRLYPKWLPSSLNPREWRMNSMDWPRFQ